uniref:Bowman-Birk serine protease inhibitors family domain-containing protein n=1 Tax=Leersia perrieri TaxID=77586 RepID=A0A0D9UWC1_9ORYZ
MKNKLVMLSLLGALLFAGFSAAAVANDNIVLPTDIGDDNEANAVWPWGKCCDNIEKSPLRSLPPRYKCNDRVRQCAPTCSHCLAVPTPSPLQHLFVCLDWFVGFNPGPKCSTGNINGGEKHCSGGESVKEAPVEKEESN